MNLIHPSTLFCLGGVSGVGKSAVQNELLRRYGDKIGVVRRLTTRKPHPDEDPRTIWSLSVQDFLKAERRRDLTALFIANRTFYAVSLDEVRQCIARGHQCVCIVSASAGVALRQQAYPQLQLIYLRVSDPAMLMRRLHDRGHVTDEISMRMHEYHDADEQWAMLANHVVYNDDGTPLSATVDAIACLLGLPVAEASVAV